MAIFSRKEIQATAIIIDPIFPLKMRSPVYIPAYIILGSLTNLGLLSNSLSAQVVPDSSLGTETNTANNVTEITGGTQAGDNLFHSFREFSVETGATAFFNNGTQINNIIGRVTGNSISNIDGVIRANGDANLILINPNGINLGSNARLDIGGSFLGSTAESIIFDNGASFSADLDTQPLLTISTPVGLQLGQQAQGIAVAGQGLDGGLEIAAGNTFALVGNGITFDGGVVSVESGRIDLGSVESGTVSITEIETGWQLGYEAVSQFSSLQLRDESALLNPNAAANPTGGIQVQGSNITLERSQIMAQTTADAAGGDIIINATESMVLGGAAALGENASHIANNVVPNATGNGGSIEISTERLDIQPRSFIDNSIFGSGTAGDIIITAGQINLTGAGFLEFQQKYRIDVLEGNLQPGSRITGIFAGTATDGTAGDIQIETDSLNLTEGAIIFTPVFTSGNGGNINVTATEISLDASAIQNGGGIDSTADASLGNINLNSDRLEVTNGASVINATFGDVTGGNINVFVDSIELQESSPESILSTGLFTNTTLGTGAGGDLSIVAQNIRLDEAVIASNSGSILPDGTIIPFGGPGGNINIQASESIEASGIVFRPDNPALSVGSGIGTTTYSAADGGNLTVKTGRLTVREGGDLTSATFGAGDGGQLTVDATDSVELVGFINERGMNRGGLFASSDRLVANELETNGASGDISVRTPNLTVRDGAIIDVRSTGANDAGSIKLFTDTAILTAEGSLSATTEDGAGGNVQIETRTLELDQGLINASVLGEGTGGDIEISARDSVEVKGIGFAALQATLFAPQLLSPEFLASLSIDQINQGILAATAGTGDAGTISIEAANLKVEEGGLIATATGGAGTAGTILLNGTESIVVDGSFISNNTLFGGQGGDISVETNQLEILQGGQITASTLGMGDGGNVKINAAESVVVVGDGGESTLVSNISVGALPLLDTSGNGGDLTINTGELDIDGGEISIGSVGSGDAGNLEVDAESIMLDNQGVISADTQSGVGGNIVLNSDNIILQGESLTTATAIGSADGGNITIEANNIVALEDSQIIANAFMGMGGNIQIDTEGLLICTTCQITASSTLGVDGVVDIETLEPTTLNTLDVRPQLTQSQEEVAVACPSEPTANASKLTITGRGGLPDQPQELLYGRSLIEFAPPPAAAAATATKATLPSPARGWYRNARGKVILTAQATGLSPRNSGINGANCHN
ncbi:MAG: filamentous hemagglutinin N-terminal domain-containing protein [Cyanobacteria bacterium P01_C01_bin.72]